MGKNFDAAFVLFALLALISFDVRPAGQSDLDEAEHFKARTDTVRYELTSPEGAAKARQRVEATVESGLLSWSLVDPKGRAVLEGEGRGKIETDTGEIDKPLPGTWTLTVDLKDATGHYRVAWTAR